MQIIVLDYSLDCVDVITVDEAKIKVKDPALGIQNEDVERFLVEVGQYNTDMISFMFSDDEIPISHMTGADFPYNADYYED